MLYGVTTALFYMQKSVGEGCATSTKCENGRSSQIVSIVWSVCTGDSSVSTKNYGTITVTHCGYRWIQYSPTGINRGRAEVRLACRASQNDSRVFLSLWPPPGHIFSIVRLTANATFKNTRNDGTLIPDGLPDSTSMRSAHSTRHGIYHTLV